IYNMYDDIRKVIRSGFIKNRLYPGSPPLKGPIFKLAKSSKCRLDTFFVNAESRQKTLNKTSA
ncbi:hypothetical protein, partial [Yersinia aldovae]|uniref:hypothetical protein n=1 Tax=Yersinia aldovae TaxID=29483 RepID=UPI001C95BBEF